MGAGPGERVTPRRELVELVRGHARSRVITYAAAWCGLCGRPGRSR